MKRWLTVATAVGLAVGVACWAGQIEKGQGPHPDRMPDPNTDAKLRIDGCTTCGPIANAFAEVFGEHCSELEITVKKTGSANGMAALIAGRCDAALMSRPLRQKELRRAVEKGVLPCVHVLAIDGVAVIVHPTNPVKKLSLKQVRKVFTGQITNWKQLGGRDANIVPITRDSSSGTFETFHRVVMDGKRVTRRGEVAVSPASHARIKTTPGAISYVGVGFVDEKVKALAINDVQPTQRTIAAGEYPISRRLFLVTDGWPANGTPLRQLVTFPLTPAGERLIRAKGFVPLTAERME
jgi:phosphate transport system substrate-binding protein